MIYQFYPLALVAADVQAAAVLAYNAKETVKLDERLFAIPLRKLLA